MKTKTFRVVPLHEHLIEQGFLDFVKAHGKGPLFYNPAPESKNDATSPKRPRAGKTRERLAAWVRKLGLDDPGLRPNHAWRHTFKQVAERSGISERMSDTITGHAPTTAGARLRQADCRGHGERASLPFAAMQHHDCC